MWLWHRVAEPNGFMIVAEEEGTDNFANNNNAAGTLKH